MYKATVLYGHPSDEAAFDRHYEDVHIPLARAMSGIAHWSITKPDPGPDGTAPAYYLVAELYAATRAELLAAFDSSEGKAAANDVATFADGGVQFLFGSEEIVSTSDKFWGTR